MIYGEQLETLPNNPHLPEPGPMDGFSEKKVCQWSVTLYVLLHWHGTQHDMSM